VSCLDSSVSASGVATISTNSSARSAEPPGWVSSPEHMAVPLFDTRTPLEPLMDRLRERVLGAIDGGKYILGPEVGAFEGEFARFTGVEHAVGVANGTDAIAIALRALGVGPGDEVVVPSFTFYASAEAIAYIGATPVFCDIDLDTYCVTPETVKAALTPRTRAILAVDLFGNPAPIAEILALGLPVVEDAAQAAGSTLGGRPAGSLGTLATFSFFPSKNLPCFGDGGAITTNDGELAERVRMIRFHGSRDKSRFELVGTNSRLDELQAAALRVLLPQLENWSEGRWSAGRAYAQEGLGEYLALPRPREEARVAWHLYVARHPRADELIQALAAVGVGARAYYRRPLHRQPAMAPWAPTRELPATEEAARTHLALPISPVLSAEQVHEVVAAVRGALGPGGALAAVRGALA
jgi:dTDP-4-amino-4,6-dideoxygalactose transaminase